MNNGTCLYCGASLEGRRDDTKFCTGSHKQLNWKKKQLKVLMQKKIKHELRLKKIERGLI